MAKRTQPGLIEQLTTTTDTPCQREQFVARIGNGHATHSVVKVNSGPGAGQVFPRGHKLPGAAGSLRPSITRMPEGTPVTCKRCAAKTEPTPVQITAEEAATDPGGVETSSSVPSVATLRRTGGTRAAAAKVLPLATAPANRSAQVAASVADAEFAEGSPASSIAAQATTPPVKPVTARVATPKPLNVRITEYFGARLGRDVSAVAVARALRCSLAEVERMCYRLMRAGIMRMAGGQYGYRMYVGPGAGTVPVA